MAKDSELETRMIVIAPSSSVTPDQITRLLHNSGLEITIKETCYGAMIEGSKEEINKALAAVRKLDPNRIFTKVRGFPIGDARRCRAHHGSRPGFTQLEIEWDCLKLIEKGVCAAEKGEIPPEKAPPGKLSVKDLRKIIDEVKQ